MSGTWSTFAANFSLVFIDISWSVFIFIERALLVCFDCNVMVLLHIDLHLFQYWLIIGIICIWFHSMLIPDELRFWKLKVNLSHQLILVFVKTSQLCHQLVSSGSIDVHLMVDVQLQFLRLKHFHGHKIWSFLGGYKQTSLFFTNVQDHVVTLVFIQNRHVSCCW